MESFKIANFQNSHAGTQFPTYRAVNGDEANRIRQSLSELLKIDDCTSDLAIPLALANRQIPYGGLSALDEGFDLARVFEALDIRPDDSVYINWHRFNANDIDAIAVADLTLYFDDIWYPSSDDIDIFDDTLCWVLVVSHEGMIGFIKF